MVDKLVWSPTLAFTTATPTLSSSTFEAWISNGFVFYAGYIATADGGGATQLTATPPLVPQDLDIMIPGCGWAVVDGTYSDPIPYQDLTNNTAESRVQTFYGFPAFTDDKVCGLAYSGFYPIGNNYTSFTSTATWTTGTPASITAVSNSKQFGNALLGFNSQISADSNGATAVTLTLPQQPPDRDIYLAAAMNQKVKTSAEYANCLATIDAVTAGAASRLLASNYFITATDAEQVAISAAWISELGGWKPFAISPTWASATLTPAAPTEKGFYTVYDGMCFFTLYYYTADGNASTVPTFELPPVTPAITTVDIPCMAYQTQHSDVKKSPGAYVSSSQAIPGERKLRFKDFTTLDNSEAGSVTVTGWYPIEGEVK